MELAAVIKEMPATEKWLALFVITVSSIVSPVLGLLVTVGFLVVVDCILGIWASLKQGQKFTKNKFTQTIAKMFVYHTVLVLGFHVQHFMLFDFVPLTKVAATMIGLAEMISVYENASVILEKPVFKGLISMLASKKD